METVAGVFSSPSEARNAASELSRSGFATDNINLLLPGASEKQVHSIPTSDTEQPGVGGAIGGALGAALGIAGGFELGAGVAALIPGVGPILAIGLAGAAILGAGGLAAGAAAGKAADDHSTEGVPSDEIFFYEDALRQGRSLVIYLAKDKREAERAQKILRANHAESIDAARDAWWIGLRDVEAEHYFKMAGRSFETDHDAYRAGFEAALRTDCRGKNLEEASDCLKWSYPELWNTEPFRAGFERGRTYWNERVSAPSGHAS